MIIKLDIGNAFDRVKHSFLYKVLLSFGFSTNFVNLIKSCTEKSCLSPLVNGRPTSYFQASRGISQGCPLSPFLYILMVDSLRRKLTTVKNLGIDPDIRIIKDIEPIHHALFVDDFTAIGGASINIAKVFSGILQDFCSISGALINKRKSDVFGWNIEQNDI